MPILEAKNIVKSYANHIALNDVSISVAQGSIFGLLGPNGAGKTSLIRIINQITGPDKGEVFFEGKKLQQKDISRIGYLPEERGLYKKMKVGEQAIYLAQLKGISKSEAKKKLRYWFEKFEIAAWWDKKVEELSKGMQQKIQFIVTILHEPELLIFDEPFSGFDPINTNLLKQEILQLKKQGATIIFSTHNMESVEELCDDIALINNSTNILSGKLSKIKKEYKSNIYKIKFSDKARFLDLSLRYQYKILEKETTNDSSSMRVKLLDNKVTTNQLIQSILPYGNIISFEEEIPTMNNIFIKLVGKENPKDEDAQQLQKD